MNTSSSSEDKSSFDLCASSKTDCVEATTAAVATDTTTTTSIREASTKLFPSSVFASPGVIPPPWEQPAAAEAPPAQPPLLHHQTPQPPPGPRFWEARYRRVSSTSPSTTTTTTTACPSSDGFVAVGSSSQHRLLQFLRRSAQSSSAQSFLSCRSSFDILSGAGSRSFNSNHAHEVVVGSERRSVSSPAPGRLPTTPINEGTTTPLAAAPAAEKAAAGSSLSIRPSTATTPLSPEIVLNEEALLLAPEDQEHFASAITGWRVPPTPPSSPVNGDFPAFSVVGGEGSPICEFGGSLRSKAASSSAASQHHHHFQWDTAEADGAYDHVSFSNVGSPTTTASARGHRRSFSAGLLAAPEKAQRQQVLLTASRSFDMVSSATVVSSHPNNNDDAGAQQQQGNPPTRQRAQHHHRIAKAPSIQSFGSTVVVQTPDSGALSEGGGIRRLPSDVTFSPFSHAMSPDVGQHRHPHRGALGSASGEEFVRLSSPALSGFGLSHQSHRVGGMSPRSFALTVSSAGNSLQPTPRPQQPSSVPGDSSALSSLTASRQPSSYGAGVGALTPPPSAPSPAPSVAEQQGPTTKESMLSQTSLHAGTTGMPPDRTSTCVYLSELHDDSSFAAATADSLQQHPMPSAAADDHHFVAVTPAAARPSAATTAPTVLPSQRATGESASLAAAAAAAVGGGKKRAVPSSSLGVMSAAPIGLPQQQQQQKQKLTHRRSSNGPNALRSVPVGLLRGGSVGGRDSPDDFFFQPMAAGRAASPNAMPFFGSSGGGGDFMMTPTTLHHPQFPTVANHQNTNGAEMASTWLLFWLCNSASASAATARTDKAIDCAVQLVRNAAAELLASYRAALRRKGGSHLHHPTATAAPHHASRTHDDDDDDQKILGAATAYPRQARSLRGGGDASSGRDGPQQDDPSLDCGEEAVLERCCLPSVVCCLCHTATCCCLTAPAPAANKEEDRHILHRRRRCAAGMLSAKDHDGVVHGEERQPLLADSDSDCSPGVTPTRGQRHPIHHQRRGGGAASGGGFDMCDDESCCSPSDPLLSHLHQSSSSSSSASAWLVPPRPSVMVGTAIQRLSRPSDHHHVVEIGCDDNDDEPSSGRRGDDGDDDDDAFETAGGGGLRCHSSTAAAAKKRDVWEAAWRASDPERAAPTIGGVTIHTHQRRTGGATGGSMCGGCATSCGSGLSSLVHLASRHFWAQ